MYASIATARKGIATVQANAADLDQYEIRTNKAGEHYFVVKAKNHQVIGNSEGYSGTTNMKNGIRSVSKNVWNAVIENINIKVTGETASSFRMTVLPSDRDLVWILPVSFGL